MERVLQVFASHEEAEKADRAFYASLTPNQRVDLLLDLVARERESMGEAGERLERVSRVVELERS
jgi:hypothetical protein